MCVNLGPPGCSTGVTSLYSPLSGKTTAESPDTLAKVLSDSGISQIVDDRPPTEILVIALDRSGSMNSNFEDLGAPPPAPAARTIPITAHDAQVALLRLRNSSWGPVFQQQLYKCGDSFAQRDVLAIVAQLHYPVCNIAFSASSSSPFLLLVRRSASFSSLSYRPRLLTEGLVPHVHQPRIRWITGTRR